MNRNKKRAIAFWGCALLLAGGGLFLFFHSRSPSHAYALEQADYPSMASHPKNSTSSRKWEAWQKSLASFQQEGSAIQDMDGFFRRSIPLLLQGIEGENKIASPLNVYMALGMLAETTGGESRAEILKALDCSTMEELRSQAQAVWKSHYRDDGLVTSILASSLWLDEDVSFQEDTLQRLAQTYYASSYQGDLESEPVSRAIQSWIDEQTGGLLSPMTQNISLAPGTLLAMVTTVYFKAPWAEELNPADTLPGTFHGITEDLPAQLMHDSYQGTYIQGDRFSAVGKALESGGGTMWFLLPEKGMTPQQLLEDSQAVEFLSAPASWPDGKDVTVHLTLPRMDVSSQTDLLGVLEGLGISQVLQPDTADFSPLTQEEGLSLTQALHGVRVKADEEGVSAAAYTMTAVGAGLAPEESVDFVLDRPFLFAIVGHGGLPLFVGAVYRP